MTFFEFLAADAVTRIVATELRRFATILRDAVMMIVVMITMMVVLAVGSVNMFGGVFAHRWLGRRHRRRLMIHGDAL